MVVNTVLTKAEDLFILSPKDSIEKALKIFSEEDVLSLPVCEHRKFLGAIHRTDILQSCYDKNIDKDILLKNYKVENFIKTDLPIIPATDLVETVAEYLEHKHLPFVAVEDNLGYFAGIVTHKAIFHAFREIFGLNKGYKLSVTTYDVPGQLSKLSRIITENGGDIISFVVLDPKSKLDVRECVVRLKSENFDELVKKVRNAGFNVNN